MPGPCGQADYLPNSSDVVLGEHATGLSRTVATKVEQKQKNMTKKKLSSDSPA